MKIYKYLLYTLIAIGTLSTNYSCERDDICAEGTPTTPFLIIKFIDFETGTLVKAPAELQIKAVGSDTPFPFKTVEDLIRIPLRNKESITEYEFTINSNTSNNTDTDPAPDKDIVSFQYTIKEEYVSSACGFKVNYEGLTFSPPVAGDDGNWIKNITIQRENITDETTAHVFIFH